MAQLDRIVNVQISLNTTAIKEQSFSDILILGGHVLSTQRSLVITDADQLLDLGMLPADPIYRAALAVFSQIPTVPRVFIGRQQVDTASLSVNANPVEGTVYSVTLGWRVAGVLQTATASYTALGAPTVTSVASGLAAAINATAVPVTAVPTVGVIALNADVSGTPFTVSTSLGLALAQPTTTELPSLALAAVQAETDDWYGVVLASRAEADVIDAAEWVEANEKLLGTSSADAGVLDPGDATDIASQLKVRQFFRTNVWYHANAATEYLEAAIMAKAFTFYPGGETWALKRLGGISFDNLMEGQALATFEKNANTFEPFRNFAITQNGRVAAGEWIDVIRFRDWLSEQIKISVVSAMINANGKVPYTDNGIQVIVTAMRKVLDLGVTRGGIAPPEVAADDDQRMIPSYTVTFPRSSAVAFNDKANRVLRDVGFTARLAGAIHAVEIKGTLTYAL